MVVFFKMNMATPLFYYINLKKDRLTMIDANIKNSSFLDLEIFSWKHHEGPFLCVSMEAYSCSNGPIILLLLLFSAKCGRSTVILLCY